MADFVSLTCPSCGSRLQVTNDLDTFACSYCGNELRVRRAGGIVALQPVMESLGRVEQGIQHIGDGVDTTASELAIQRLDREIAQARQRLDQTPGSNPRGAIALTILGAIGVLGTLSGGNAEGGAVIAWTMLIWGAVWWWRAQTRAKAATDQLVAKLSSLQQEKAIHMQRVRHRHDVRTSIVS